MFKWKLKVWFEKKKKKIFIIRKKKMMRAKVEGSLWFNAMHYASF